ncbi:tetratricopeptide repeat protein [Coleofasciculus sp. FACHB-1120]|uniref:tetratricopeptide repeat protein n=1 Tax=Coleofasciculus sp. FACHB-1120 TaxID=2692783 RepID=UPI001F556A80|nr:tetratricopeptide repeat protein [Coleofasciculus sp. FACHB-1120]
MPSKKLSQQQKQISKLQPEIDTFLTINQQPLAELLTFIDFVDEKLTIGFVEINFAKDRDALIEILKHHPQCQEIQFAACNFSSPDLRFIRDAIVEELAEIKIEQNKKLVLIIVGLEHSIGMYGEYPPVLQDLNFVRDAFTTSVPHPILLFLPDYALTRLAKYAPDFWAWKVGIFQFKTAESTKDYAINTTLQSERILGSLEVAEKQERIDLLQRLLMEYSPYNHHGMLEENLLTRINILNQLGVAYRSLGEIKKAEDSLQEALRLTNDDENLTQIKASVLHELGILFANLGKIKQAIAYYQQSLEIKERIGDVQGKAATLHNLANIYADTGEIEQAIAYYQQSLEIKERIGDVQGKAKTLQCLGIIYADTGEIEQAIAYFQQSLEIFERIGDVQGKAATLHCLGIIYADTGEIEQAIAYYQQSLEIKERIGDVKGKAATLHSLATICANTGEIEQAIAYYQQSLEIEERIGNVKGKAATLHQLATICANTGEIEQAIAYYQQSLEIKERIGDVQGKAATLAMLGQLLALQEDSNTSLNYLQQSLDILQRLQSPNAEKVREAIARVQKLADA